MTQKGVKTGSILSSKHSLCRLSVLTGEIAPTQSRGGGNQHPNWEGIRQSSWQRQCGSRPSRMGQQRRPRGRRATGPAGTGAQKDTMVRTPGATWAAGARRKRLRTGRDWPSTAPTLGRRGTRERSRQWAGTGVNMI